MKERLRYWLVAAASLFVVGTLLRADIITTPLPFIFSNGQVIDASQFNSNFNAIVTGVNTNAATAGANSNITALNGLTTAIGPALGGSSRFYGGVSGGTATALTVAAVTPNNFSLVAGYEVSFTAASNNTGPTTLSVAGTAVKSVLLPTGSGLVELTGNEIGSSNRVIVVYDGTQYQLLTPVTPAVGSIQDYAGASAPAGWLLTDGTSYLRTDFAGLFSLIGTIYGSADSLHFNVPDIRGRMTVMADNSAGRITTATCSAPSTLGTGCGAQNYTVAQANLPSVNFTVSGITLSDTRTWGFQAASSGANAFGTNVPAYGTTAANTTPAVTSTGGSLSVSAQGTAASGGSGTALSVLNPTMVLYKIIKY